MIFGKLCVFTKPSFHRTETGFACIKHWMIWRLYISKNRLDMFCMVELATLAVLHLVACMNNESLPAQLKLMMIWQDNFL